MGASTPHTGSSGGAYLRRSRPPACTRGAATAFCTVHSDIAVTKAHSDASSSLRSDAIASSNANSDVNAISVLAATAIAHLRHCDPCHAAAHAVALLWRSYATASSTATSDLLAFAFASS